VYGFEFAGSAADYYQLLKSAYRVIKDVDPQAVVHLAGLTWWHDPSFLDQLLALAAADPESAEYGYFFDVISLHVYFRTETVKTIIDEVNAIQRRYGMEKPIWINEMNAPPNQDPEWPVDRPSFDVDLEQQAWFILQAMALGFASGAERISVYKLIDIHLPSGGESFGVVRPDYSRRPAYDAYKLATGCFGSFSAVTLEEDPASFQVTFERLAGLSHIAWSRTISPTTVQITATSDSATLISWTKTPRQVRPVNGSYSLKLPAQRCDDECFIGGEPIILVEEMGIQNHVDQCIDWAVARLMAEASTPGSELSPLPESIRPELNEAALQALVVPTASATATPVATKTIRPTITPSPPGISVPRQVASEEQHQDSDVGGITQPSTVTLALKDDTIAGAISDLNDESETSGAKSESIGLWFLGAGLGVAVGVAIYWRYYEWRRNRTDLEE
jgi:hypothetical protein